ncbi:hypothetical protein HPB52_013841 [Rhipicephalus sanguineus]|uniref:Uncharacterized protein n=1 Tax=Rhipicephalus sanguineus TaxID=34632 RepID=A0A9D4T7L4_RHISA|nr:hypothetical protein HPB52_013841 [Rhipicephalus sanguineus]
MADARVWDTRNWRFYGEDLGTLKFGVVKVPRAVVAEPAPCLAFLRWVGQRTGTDLKDLNASRFLALSERIPAPGADDLAAFPAHLCLSVTRLLIRPQHTSGLSSPRLNHG